DIQRLTALEAQNLYVGPDVETETLNIPGLTSEQETKPHPIKGGLIFNSYLTYNCLKNNQDIYSGCLRTFWTCPVCDLHLPFTPLERIQHEADCTARVKSHEEAGK
uniref:Uncharacterized protein n=1 Tax=Callorhinchus milii TaxID=7868 RepID=A0A4W3GQK5_CALMI